MINETIRKANQENSSHDKGRYHKKIPRSISAAILALSMLIVPLNLSHSFAQVASGVPVIGEIAKLLTFRNYTFEDDIYKGNVKIPEIMELNDEVYQKQINRLIEERVDKALELSKERAKEYKEAFIATGGSEESYAEKKIEVKVDYKLFSDRNNRLSFLVYSHESLAAVYATYDYYNINLTTNEMLTLKDLLGTSYKEKIVEATNRYINETKDEISYFEETLEGNWIFREDVDYYIDENNSVVVVFDKYELAPGAFGRLEVSVKDQE